MFGAIPRSFWNSSNRFNPRKASRRIRMLHHSPTRSRLRAIGHCRLPKLLCCMGSSLNGFEDRRHTLAAADALRRQREAFALALQNLRGLARDPRTGRTQRMADGDRTAIDVDLL